MAKAIIVDDSDPRLKYTGDWFLDGVHGEFDQTTHGSRTLGSQLTFTFNGTSVAVFGTVGPTDSTGPPKSSYTLDGAPPVTFIAPETTGIIKRVMYYQSPTLSYGEHSLVVTDAQDLTYFWIDYILYTPSSAITTPPPPPPFHSAPPSEPRGSSPFLQETITTTRAITITSSSFSTTTTTTTMTIDLSLSTSSLSTNSTSTMGPHVFTSWTIVTPSATVPAQKGSISNDSAARSSVINVGAIVGGAAGGGVFLAVTCALLYFLCRRKRRSNYLWESQKDMDIRMPSLPVVSDNDLAPSVFDLDSHTESLSRTPPANVYNHENDPWIRNDSPRSEYAISWNRA